MAEELFEAMKRAYPEFANLLGALIVHHNCPCHIVAEPAVLAIQHHANDEAEAQYSILPMTRGKANVGDVYIRYQTR